MKISVIVNPESGKGNGRKFYNQILPIVENNSNIEVFLTERPLHAVELAKKLENSNRIIVCGGDGTLHEVINGINLNSKSILGLIPIGSGNDFSISYHKSIKDVVSLFKFYISDNVETRNVNFGNVQVTDEDGTKHTSRLINSFGVGFDAKVAFYNQRNKVLSGVLSYIVAILKALFEFSQIEFTGEYDNNKISGNVLFCAVGNGESIGGGLYLMPNAKVDDDILDLSVVTIKSRLKLLTLLPKAMNNTLSSRMELKQYKFKDLNLTLKNPFFVHIDGEIISDKAKNISISISESNIKFLCRG